MAKIPEKPEYIFQEFTSDFRAVFGPDLISIILYGSGARNDYVPGKSDINFLIVLSEQGIDNLGRVFGVLPKWRKRRVALPLVMTKAFIDSSLDCYPVEFLNMKRCYVLVFGEDVLKDLVFDKSALRLQVERELKGKLLLLRTRYLETEGKGRRVEDLIKESVTAFIAVFNALLYLRDVEVPLGRGEVVKAVAKVFAVETGTLLRCVDIKEGRSRLAASEAEDVFQGYAKELVQLTDLVDKIKV